ncbi:MAG: hypothetical protein KKH94_11375 [Candidatus Omnitrophica bacterium]|nr:hypothetical protein [Candidatus Omnitrophota bacterium]
MPINKKTKKKKFQIPKKLLVTKTWHRFCPNCGEPLFISTNFPIGKNLDISPEEKKINADK